MRDVARSALRSYLLSRAGPQYEPRERHIWVIRPDHLGDLLFVTPGLRRLRRALPDWHITLAVGPWSKAVVESNPDVDDVVTIPFPGFTRDESVRPWKPYQLLTHVAETLRAARPAAAVILRDDHWWAALLARVAGAPTIIGADDPTMNGLLTNAVPIRSQHWAARNIEVLEFAARVFGATINDRIPSPGSDPLRWEVSDADRESAATLLRTFGIDRPFAVIHPGSGAPVKLWPVDRWAQIADDLTSSGLGVVLTGSEAEQSLVTAIVDAARSVPISLAGKTTLTCLAAVFEQSELVAGVDSGPLHLAVAVDAPTVHVYGPSDVAAYGPWGDPQRHRVVSAGMCCPRCGDLSLSRPEGAGCMTAVSVDSVLGSLRDLLSVNG